MADRLYIEKKTNDFVITDVDKSKLLGLDKSSIDRTELFLFAMAMGIIEKRRTALVASHGFILDKSFENFNGAMSALYSLQINELRNLNEEEKIGNKDEAYLIAEEYANTGFQVIANWLGEIKGNDEEELLWDLIVELDQTYEALFPNNIN